MIKIIFTCHVCGKTSDIGIDDVEEKNIVPVCDGCYNNFVSKKELLIKSFKKKLTTIYNEFGIPSDTFNAGEDIIID